MVITAVCGTAVMGSIPVGRPMKKPVRDGWLFLFKNAVLKRIGIFVWADSLSIHVIVIAVTSGPFDFLMIGSSGLFHAVIRGHDRPYDGY